MIFAGRREDDPVRRQPAIHAALSRSMKLAHAAAHSLVAVDGGLSSSFASSDATCRLFQSSHNAAPKPAQARPPLAAQEGGRRNRLRQDEADSLRQM
jgi:hypothetical protein